MTQLEDLLQQATFENCTVQVERPYDSLLLLTVTSSSGTENSVTTEVYKYETEESIRTEQRLVTHSVNQRHDGAFYATSTRILMDMALGRVNQLQVKVCDRLGQEEAQTGHERPSPLYPCQVSVRKATCTATS